jgi:hypothetical protein
MRYSNGSLRVTEHKSATKTIWFFGVALIATNILWVFIRHMAIPMFLAIVTRVPFEPRIDLFEVIVHAILLFTGVAFLNLKIANVVGEFILGILQKNREPK